MEKFIGKQQFHDSIKKECGISIMPAITNMLVFKEGMADYASSFYVAYKVHQLFAGQYVKKLFI
jgi:hypothetical protein